jgi:hypothetical protein
MTPDMLLQLLGHPAVAPFVQSAMEGGETAMALVGQQLQEAAPTKFSHRQIRDNEADTRRGAPNEGDVFFSQEGQLTIADPAPGGNPATALYNALLYQVPRSDGQHRTNAFLPHTSPRNGQRGPSSGLSPERALQIANPNDEFI